MSVLVNAKKHFKSVIGDDLISMDVAEWDSKVYFKPSATLKQTEVVVALHSEHKLAEAMANVLIMRCLNEDGSKMFKAVDLYDLMNNVDPLVITRVSSEILDYEPSVEEIKKK
jgi:hypothetical protein|tara:strand:- start:229 stop:567 length:339 start_codon:yes stop_codon:yes gene_type:complete